MTPKLYISCLVENVVDCIGNFYLMIWIIFSDCGFDGKINTRKGKFFLFFCLNLSSAFFVIGVGKMESCSMIACFLGDCESAMS